MLPESVTLIVHTDQRHAYLEVDQDLVHTLGIKPNKYSFYSPVDAKYFLEEDIDGLALIEKLSENNVMFKFHHIEHIHDAPCRMFLSARRH